MKVLIIGAGYTGAVVARRAVAEVGWQVAGTRRSRGGLSDLCKHGIVAIPFDANSGVADELRRWLVECTHLLICAAPDRQAPLRDPVFDALAPIVGSGGAPALAWTGYLSSIGVYGDHGGHWVDEDAECRSRQQRSVMRLAAERQWQTLAGEQRLPMSVLRLSGIYGPGRNAIEQARQGRARMVIKPDQVFNRIHVDDIAEAALLCMQQDYDGVLNISDDEPSPPQDVIRYAHELLGLAPPAAVDFDSAELSPMARSFYGENKRVNNARSKRDLGLVYRYPNYRKGLVDILTRDRLRL